MWDAGKFVASCMVVAPACATAGGLHAQTVPAAPQITVSTHLVQVSVIVRDGKGNPAAGLSKDDFVVRDQGRPRSLSVFEVESDGAAPKATLVSAPNTFSNRTSNDAGTVEGAASGTGNITIILLDALNTLLGSAPVPYENTPPWMEGQAAAYAKQHLLKSLRQMNPQDRIAVYGLSGKLRLLCDFTCSRDELIAAVSGYDPSSQTLRELVEPGEIQIPGVDEGFLQAINAGDKMQAAQMNAQRAQMTMMSLRMIANHVARIPGRKSLIWLTADLSLSGEAVARVLAPANIAAYPVDARGLMTTNFPVSVDAITPPMSKPAGQPMGIATMLEMAEDTGGHAYVNTNDLSGAIREVAEDTGARYTLGFYVDATSIDGKFHELKVHVNKPGMTVHAPKGYFAVKDAVPPAERGREALLAALESPFDASTVPLEVSVARVEQPKPQMLRLRGSVDIKDLPLAQAGGARHGRLDVLVVEQDAAGNLLHQVANHLDLKLTEAQYGAYLKSGIRFQEYVQPHPGTAVVRVLVREPMSQELGSVVIPLPQVK